MGQQSQSGRQGQQGGEQRTPGGSSQGLGGSQQSQSGSSSQQGGRPGQGADASRADSSLGGGSDRDMQQGSTNTNRSSGEQSR
jgi:hypothetical protein